MEQIEYTRTVVPSSMRSPYWKYFGFPSDNGNNILTRQKIVCTICNTAIAYNKNTSNLRTHLMAKHVETFQKIIVSNEAMVSDDMNSYSQAGEDDTVQTNNIVKLKRRRSEQSSKDDTTDIQQSKNEFSQPIAAEGYLTITEFKSNKQISKETSRAQDLNAQQIIIPSSEYTGFDNLNDSEMIEVTEPTDEDQLPDDTLNQTETDHTNNPQQSFTYVDIIQPVEIQHQNQQQQHSLENMLADMIQTDLLSLDMIQSQGFCKYNQQLTGLSLDIQTLQRVQDILRQRFISTQEVINNHIKQLSQNTPYSLSIEYYKDMNGQSILNIYFNYLNDGQTELNSILYYSGFEKIYSRFNKDLLDDLLKDVNLKNCCAIVVPDPDSVDKFTKEFAKCHDIAIIECLESMLSRCLNQIFDMMDFRVSFEFLCDLTDKKTWLIKPTLKRRCCWSKLHYFEFMLDNLDQDKLEIYKNIKKSLDYIRPLKMALDVVTDEPLPLCTLSRPLITKLFEEHFCLLNQEKTSMLTEIQEILEKELKQRVITSNFLNEATFFDVRFERDFALQEPVFDPNHLKSKVCERFKDVLDVSYITKPINIKTEEKSSSLLLNSKKSSLKTFFKRNSVVAETTADDHLKTNLDLEFENYQNESCLDLDQNPVLWWQQQISNYKELHKIAKYYLVIPCCSVPRLYRLDMEQRSFKLERRKHLNQYCQIEQNLWYLYYNDLTATDIKF